jgi:type I restriction enzyme R subunit
MLQLAQERLDNLNFLDSIGKEEATQNLLNTALEDVIFQFIKVGEEELKIADEFKEILRKTRESLLVNIDPRDPYFVSLREELERIFRIRNLNELNQINMVENMHLLRKIYDQAKELNRKNDLLRAKYKNDAKYVRIHKRLTEKQTLSAKEIQLHRALMQVKQQLESKLEGQEDIIKNEAFFERYVMQLVVNEFRNNEKIPLNFDAAQNINLLIKNEYIQQYKAV